MNIYDILGPGQQINDCDVKQYFSFITDGGIKVSYYDYYDSFIVVASDFIFMCSRWWLGLPYEEQEIILHAHGDAASSTFVCPNYKLTLYGKYGYILNTRPGWLIPKGEITPYASFYKGKCHLYDKQTLLENPEHWPELITGTQSFTEMYDVNIASKLGDVSYVRQCQLKLRDYPKYAYVIVTKYCLLSNILMELVRLFHFAGNCHILTCRGTFFTYLKYVLSMGHKGRHYADMNSKNNVLQYDLQAKQFPPDILTTSTLENFNLTNHNINLQQLKPTPHTEFFEKDLLKCLVVRKSYYQEIMCTKEMKKNKKINWKPGIFTYNEYDKVSALDMCILLLGYSRNQRIVNRLNNAQLRCLEDGTNGHYLTQFAINKNYHSIREMFKACGLF
jgi:hypothetical protein